MSRKLQLRDVTVCSADSLHPHLSARALEKCLRQCDFADAILFSDTAIEGTFRNVGIARLTSVRDYSHFCLRALPRLISTPLVLVIQWDGYVIDASAWRTDFTNYDFVGAVLSTSRIVRRPVGNGGFSLRSRKLLQALTELPTPPPHVPEDHYICQQFGETLERQFAIRFAPVKVAERFSYQGRHPGAPTFGFHGVHNLWRHMSDEDIADLAASLAGNELIARRVLLLILNCLWNDRTTAASILYAQLRQNHSFESVKHHTSRFRHKTGTSGQDVVQGIEALEQIYARL